MIRSLSDDDLEVISVIYNYYIENTTVTFEEKPVSPGEMMRRLKGEQVVMPALVFEENGSVLGYAYAARWKERSAYRYTVESTVYLHRDAAGRGIGSLLYSELLEKLGSMNFHSVIAVIALPNEASVFLHEKLGFVKAAYFPEVGFKFGRWVDVGYWQQLLI